MNVAIRYYTRSGNTKKLAKEVAHVVGVKAESVSVPLREKVDILFLGCSYYAFDADIHVKEFILSNKDNIGMIVCIGTSAIMKSMYKTIKKVTDEAGVELAKDEFHCHGSFGPLHKGRPNEADLEKVRTFARTVIEKKN